MFIRIAVICATAMLLVLVAPACLAETWELGALGGFGFINGLSARTPGGATADVGFRKDGAWGFFAGENMYRYLGGELRYLYRSGDVRLSSGSERVHFGAHSHLVHYDALLHVTERGSVLRPYVAFGGGVRVFQGTGEESAFQPLSRFALLTHTQDTKPLLSVGGGVKYQIAPNILVRGEVRDYVSPAPDRLITPTPGVRLSDWVHDVVPMIGVTITFGRSY